MSNSRLLGPCEGGDLIYTNYVFLLVDILERNFGEKLKTSFISSLHAHTVDEFGELAAGSVNCCPAAAEQNAPLGGLPKYNFII